MKKFKFVDLFSGVGGFHQALKSEGGVCVFASEIDQECINVYKNNFNVDSNHDITKTNASDIPKHDVLTGGFPCQAFSKAGKQQGLNDTRGTLFFDIERILKHHKTKYIILENVRNLTSHDHGRTWQVIQHNLKTIGYRLTEKPLILSPHEFGVPHLRERVFIVGKYDPKRVNTPLKINLDNNFKKSENTVYSILEDEKVDQKYYISNYEESVLEAWDEFYKGIDREVIGFPVWAEYFTDFNEEDGMPKWKKDFIKKNKDLYLQNKNFIDKWLKKHKYLKNFQPTHKKFEWQAGDKINSLWEGIIQFRPSGIRVKTPDTFPALVAIVQIPIIGKYKRRLTEKEAAKLQSFNEDFKFLSSTQKTYKQLGNSVNVTLVKRIIKQIL